MIKGEKKGVVDIFHHEKNSKREWAHHRNKTPQKKPLHPHTTTKKKKDDIPSDSNRKHGTTLRDTIDCHGHYTKRITKKDDFTIQIQEMPLLRIGMVLKGMYRTMEVVMPLVQVSL